MTIVGQTITKEILSGDVVLTKERCDRLFARSLVEGIP